MPTIYIEGQPYSVPEGQNVLHVCLSLGFDLPYFCWHPGMHSVGACRQCAVKQFKDENDRQGKIVMSCMLHATDGLRISVNDPEAVAFRRAVSELLMTNHPHDCPVCDEGGECHLQDMTVMTGHNYRRYRFSKRTHRNQNLGPLVNHEMNRCIACYRCLRFYRDYAGGRDLDVFGWHNNVYFGRHEDGVLENEFSGNLVEVCPTGVFTDKTLKRHYTRKWDLQTAPSVCVHCGLGCNIIAGERYGTLRRVLNRYHSKVNGYWLCDRGRFGYEFVNHPKRIRRPLIRIDQSGVQESADPQAAIEKAVEAIRTSKGVIGIGSPRASLEANFALRELVGDDRFHCGMSDRDCRDTAMALQILRDGPARASSLREMATAHVTLILGEDVTNTAPMMALMLREAALQKEIGIATGLHIPAWQDAAVREAIQQQRGPVFIATPSATRLDDLATISHRAAPADVARLGFAVAHAIDADSPAPENMSEADLKLADIIAGELRKAERPLIVCGTSQYEPAIIQAAANVAQALCRTTGKGEIALVVPECNSLGLGLMCKRGLDTALEALQRGEADTLVILENDLYRRDNRERINAIFAAAEKVIVLDCLENDTTRRADIVLPAATFAESTGTLVNNECRAQRFFQVMRPAEPIRESWQWLDLLMMNSSERTEEKRWPTFDNLIVEMCKALPDLAAVRDAAPPADMRIGGEKIPRQPLRYSGRTSMHANVNVNEPKTPDDPDSPLAFSMEGYAGQPPAALTARYWTPGWNSVQALNRYQEDVGGQLRGGDPGRRLLVQDESSRPAYFAAVPVGFKPRKEQWLLVAVHHIFGSEELSAAAEGIAQLVPQPYLALNWQEMESLHVQEGDAIEMSVNGNQHALTVKAEDSLPDGLAGLPAGLPELANIVFPQWCRLQVEKKQ